MKLVGHVQCTKISPEFECQRQKSKVKVTGDKRTKKVRHFVRESSSGRAPRADFCSGAVLEVA